VPQLKTASGIIARVRRDIARARHVLDEIRGYQ
jgi:ribosomal protein L29